MSASLIGPGTIRRHSSRSRPKTSNPSFREPNKLPRLISASAKYQTDIKDNKLEEALEEDEEEEKHEENGEVVKTNHIEDEADDGIEADDEAEVTDVRVDEDEKDSNKSQDSGLVEKQSDEADYEDKEEDKPEGPETQSKKEEETPTTNGEHDHSHLEGKNFAGCCLHASQLIKMFPLFSSRVSCSRKIWLQVISAPGQQSWEQSESEGAQQNWQQSQSSQSSLHG